jgi:AAA15 family ATPase/GTPase
MRIQSFRIENFRNLRLLECSNVPDFMVICGGNGCGKSALLEALMIAKESVGPYGNFNIDKRAISSNAEQAAITMTLSFKDHEISLAKNMLFGELHGTEEIVVTINRKGGNNVKAPESLKRFLGYYSTNYNGSNESPGFFEYINAYRQTQKTRIQQFDLQSLSDGRTRDTLARSENKFQLTKQYLIGCHFRDLQEYKVSNLSKQTAPTESLSEIKKLFNSFFSPMKFEDIIINESTFEFEFVISTSNGKIDIDDLSSGEKEILNIFVRFHQLKPKGAVILFDEADAHLHPDLERRYLYALKELCKGSQLVITTHSPEMMLAAGAESLFTIQKVPKDGENNQLELVAETDQMYNALSDLMGSRGIVSFNQHIVFIEGENASADIEIYERSYPLEKFPIRFVPAGNSSMVRKTAEQVNYLLTKSTGFQQYFSIIDQDIERSESDPTNGTRLFRLPVYHVENLLLNPDEIFEETKSSKLSDCRYHNSNEVKDVLKQLVLSDAHLNAYAKALLDARIAKVAKDAYDSIYQKKPQPTCQDIPEFQEFLKNARNIMQSALNDDTWMAKCKGRDILKAYCNQHGFEYKSFRNHLISKIKTPPKELQNIMSQILGNKIACSK